MAPFVAERIGAEPERCRLLECRRCSHRFFDLALDDAEAGRLYADYRGPSYVSARRRWEPWYTEGANAAGESGAVIAERRRLLAEFVRRWIPAGVLARAAILDYGGDRGQFIPPELGEARYVYDISSQPTCDGVQRLVDVAALEGRRFDLVLLCHVLEHLSSPLEFLGALQGRLGRRSEGHWIYGEVPDERFRILKARDAGGRSGRSRLGSAWLVRDFFSTLCRVKLNAVPPFGVIKLHEHQAFFSAASMRTLFERAGYDVIDLRVTAAGGGGPYARVLRVLAHEAKGAASRGDQGDQR